MLGFSCSVCTNLSKVCWSQRKHKAMWPRQIVENGICSLDYTLIVFLSCFCFLSYTHTHINVLTGRCSWGNNCRFLHEEPPDFKKPSPHERFDMPPRFPGPPLPPFPGPPHFEAFPHPMFIPPGKLKYRKSRIFHV